MGRDFVRYAVQGYNNTLKLKQQSLSPCYTTRWGDLLKIYIWKYILLARYAYESVNFNYGI